MNRRDTAILLWVRTHRPDVAEISEIILRENNAMRALNFMAAMAFEAGRQFQIENPSLKLNDPSVYL